jgi:hypothetical protein
MHGNGAVGSIVPLILWSSQTFAPAAAGSTGSAAFPSCHFTQITCAWPPKSESQGLLPDRPVPQDASATSGDLLDHLVGTAE